MVPMEGDHPSNSEEMPPSDRTSETARLVAPNSTAKPSYINVASNICAFTILVIVTICCFDGGLTLFTFHPILMSCGWLVFMTSAVNAITPGDLATEWMPIRLRSARHWVLQVLGGIIIVTGFLVIVLNKIIHDKAHFVTLHAKFGLSALILMFITMSGGIGALYSLKLKQYLAPIYTKLIHGSVGLITFSIGIITIILGHFSSWWTFGDPLRYTNIVLVLIVMVLTVLRPSLKIYFRLKERLENLN